MAVETLVLDDDREAITGWTLALDLPIGLPGLGAFLASDLSRRLDL
ncbi:MULTISPECIES: hypothetical protein [unclassified Streptomyces]|nr:hypothetical protein [Streptomyces sp. CB02980]MCB8904192.1 hypothetical protein [Streptomyces sp. CB02980]